MCQAKLSPVSMGRKGSRFYIEADMLFACRSVQDDQSLVFVPVLSDGDNRLELPLVLITGKNRYRTFRLAMLGVRHNLLKGYKIRKVLKSVNHSFINYPYRICLDYEEWMQGAMVSLSKMN